MKVYFWLFTLALCDFSHGNLRGGNSENGRILTDFFNEDGTSTSDGISFDNLLQDCPPVDNVEGCVVPSFCQCNGMDYMGCTECDPSASCVFASEGLSLCLPDEGSEHHAPGQDCVVEDFGQCGGPDFQDCQRCNPGSTCSPGHDGLHYICVPERARGVMFGEPGLPDDRVRQMARVLLGVDKALDGEVYDETVDITIVREDLIRVLATEEGKQRLIELHHVHEHEYEIFNDEVVTNYKAGLCEIAQDRNSRVSQSVEDCLCSDDEPEMHCVALFILEFQEFRRRRRTMRALKGEVENQELDLGKAFDTDSLREAVASLHKDEEERRLEEAWKAVKDSLAENPEFNGDVEDSLKEARRVMDEALREVYYSDEYDFSEFDGGMNNFHRDLRRCEINVGGVGRDNAAWEYAKAANDFVESGSGCGGVECTIPIPKVPLEVRLAIQACLNNIPDALPASYANKFSFEKHAWASGFELKLSAELCVSGLSEVEDILDYVGISPCFVHASMSLKPLTGTLTFSINFSALIIFYAEASLTLMYDDTARNALGLCEPDALQIFQIMFQRDCFLCNGGFIVNFEVGYDAYFVSDSFSVGMTFDMC